MEFRIAKKDICGTNSIVNYYSTDVYNKCIKKINAIYMYFTIVTSFYYLNAIIEKILG